MANILRVTGGVVSVLPSTTFAAPTTAIFNSEDRNDGSVYIFTQSSATITLPSSGLADGYLLLASVHFTDTSNGRVSIAGRFQQTGGTGNFVNGQSGGYSRNNADNECYHNIWAFVNAPSASATFQYQWERESDAPTGATTKSTLEVIPFFYSNHGLYTGSSLSLLGSTTRSVVPIAATVSESDTVAIQRTSNAIAVKGDNKRYFVISSQWYQGRGEPATTRTQRVFGHNYAGVADLAAQSYGYYRQGTADGTGGIIHDLIETVTTDFNIEMTCYRGDGILSGEGGADVDGQAPLQAVTGLVVLELNDTADVFRKNDATGLQALDSATPLDLNAARTNNFTDAASWLTVGTVGVENNSGLLFDALTGSNIWAASTSITSGTRGTYQGNITVDGVEDTAIFHGDYIRGNQGTEDTFGFATNPIGHVSLADNADLGVSVTQAGSLHPTDTQAGTVGFWGINLDTLATAAGVSAPLTGVASTSAEGIISNSNDQNITGIERTSNTGVVTPVISINLSGVSSTSAEGIISFTEAGSVILSGVESVSVIGIVNFTETGSVGLTGVNSNSAVGTISFTEAGSRPLTGVLSTSTAGTLGINIGASKALTGVSSASNLGTLSFTEDGSISLTGIESTSNTGILSNITIKVISGEEAISVEGTINSFNNQNLVGEESTSSVDSLTPSVILSLTGVSSISSEGLISFTEAGSVALTGISSTSNIGVVSAGSAGSIALSGVSSTSNLGTLSFTKDGSVSITSVNSISNVGTISFTEAGSVVLTGVSSTSNIGTLNFAEEGSRPLTSVFSSSSEGNIQQNLSIVIIGSNSISSVGSVITSSNVEEILTGTDVISAVDNMLVFGETNITVIIDILSIVANPTVVIEGDGLTKGIDYICVLDLTEPLICDYLIK